MNFVPSTAELIRSLKNEYPGVSFLALGQTVLWDEPMKAVWRLLLDEIYPEAILIAGVHDTDYFAKTTALIQGDSAYTALPHDDILTQGLWSAAGEISALFGSEDCPTRAAYHRQGVPIERLAQASPVGNLAYLSEKTAAWGWRGIVDTRPRQRIAGDVSLSEFLPALQEQIGWAFDLSVSALAPRHRTAARQVLDSLTAKIAEMAARAPDALLTDLYEGLLPRLYELLLGRSPNNFETSRSSKLFRFNRSTCRLPRFRILDHFLNPDTSRQCRSAYDQAVAGGGMYALESFGGGALPFDVVAPGIGRGTLHVDGSTVKIDLPSGSVIEARATVRDVESLAELIEDRLGTGIAIVGKAVAFIDMCASEYLVVFHETASGYTDRTARMNDAIRGASIELNLYPIVRLRYPTWDALRALGDETSFELPSHLAQAFGAKQISTSEFAKRWRGTVDEQNAALSPIRRLRSIRSLIEAAGRTDRLQEYDSLQADLRKEMDKLSRLKSYIANLKVERRERRRALDALQKECGRHWRGMIAPLRGEFESCDDVGRKSEIGAELELRENDRQAVFIDEIASAIDLIRSWGQILKQLRSELRSRERAPRIEETRRNIGAIVAEAEEARLERVRAALLTRDSLPHTNARPTAWWLPMVDRSGAWFSEIVAGTTARLERI